MLSQIEWDLLMQISEDLKEQVKQSKLIVELLTDIKGNRFFQDPDLDEED